MLGSTGVITKCTLDELNFMHIGIIRHAMERGGPEDIGLLLALTTDSLRKPLGLIQAFMGDDIGITGTMGNPAIISPYIRDFGEVLETTLMNRTFQSEFIFRPPLNDEAAMTEAFSQYLMRFVDYDDIECCWG